MLLQNTSKNNQSTATTINQETIESKSVQSKDNSEVNIATQSNESTSADESDYEDNITVTVPVTAPLENNNGVLQTKSNNEGNSCSIKTTENIPRSLTQVSSFNVKHICKLYMYSY